MTAKTDRRWSQTEVLHDIRCVSCGSLIGRARTTKSRAMFCMDPMCPHVPPANALDTRDSAISTLAAMGWPTTHLSESFTISYQRVLQVTKARGLPGTRKVYEAASS